MQPPVYTWVGGTGFWNETANSFPQEGAPPSGNATAVIDLDGFNDTVKVTTNATSLGTLRLLGGRVQIAQASKLTVTQTFLWRAGTLAGHGELETLGSSVLNGTPESPLVLEEGVMLANRGGSMVWHSGAVR